MRFLVQALRAAVLIRLITLALPSSLNARDESSLSRPTAPIEETLGESMPLAATPSARQRQFDGLAVSCRLSVGPRIASVAAAIPVQAPGVAAGAVAFGCLKQLSRELISDYTA